MCPVPIERAQASQQQAQPIAQHAAEVTLESVKSQLEERVAGRAVLDEGNVGRIAKMLLERFGKKGWTGEFTEVARSDKIEEIVKALESIGEKMGGEWCNRFIRDIELHGGAVDLLMSNPAEAARLIGGVEAELKPEGAAGKAFYKLFVGTFGDNGCQELAQNAKGIASALELMEKDAFGGQGGEGALLGAIGGAEFARAFIANPQGIAADVLRLKKETGEEFVPAILALNDLGVGLAGYLQEGAGKRLLQFMFAKCSSQWLFDGDAEALKKHAGLFDVKAVFGRLSSHNQEFPIASANFLFDRLVELRGEKALPGFLAENGLDHAILVAGVYTRAIMYNRFYGDEKCILTGEEEAGNAIERLFGRGREAFEGHYALVADETVRVLGLLQPEKREGVLGSLAQMHRKAKADAAAGSQDAANLASAIEGVLKKAPAIAAKEGENEGLLPKSGFDEGMEKRYAAVLSAIDATHAFVRRRASLLKMNVHFGPNFDNCYRFRYAGNTPWGAEMDVGGESFKEALEKTKAAAKGIGLPVPEKGEQELLWAMIVDARMQSAEKGRQRIVAKHFPGGDDSFELTEHQAVKYAGGIKEMEEGLMKPFVRLSMLPEGKKPEITMIAHASYPQMEDELRSIYSNIPSVDCGGIAMPASLSPPILQGELRDRLGYEGLIMGDWYNMGAVRQFLKEARGKLPESMREMETETLLVILGTYAGVNWMPATGFGDMVGLKKFYRENREFADVFDQHILESVFLYAKCMPREKRPRLPFDVEKIKLAYLKVDIGSLSSEKKEEVAKLRRFVGSLSFYDKARIMLAHTGGNPFENQLMNEVEKFYGSNGDIWNRQGIIDMVFRKAYMESVSGAAFPELGSFSGESKEQDWIRALMQNPQFRAQYDAIDWNSREMRSLYAAAMEERYPVGKP